MRCVEDGPDYRRRMFVHETRLIRNRVHDMYVRRVNNASAVFIVSETVHGIKKKRMYGHRAFSFNSTPAARDRETTLPS